MSTVSTLHKKSFTDTTLPWHTLRFHSKRVTTLSLQPPHATTKPIPHLISGDEEGKLVIWDLLTRRPQTTIQLPTHAQIVDVKTVWNKEQILYCVLSRDHTFRVYALNGNTTETVFEMAVNTLNFANFEVWSEENGEITLVCCSTTDAEFIDVYRFRVGELNSLRRLLKAVDFQPLVDELFSNEGQKEKKLGIVMRFVRDSSCGVVFCGFEGGIVVGFKVISDSIEVVYVSEYHYPNPILDLFVGRAEGVVLLSSSTTREINLVKLDKYVNSTDSRKQTDSSHATGNSSYEGFPPQTTKCGTQLRVDPNILKIIACKAEHSVIRSPFPKVSHVRATKDFYVFSGWSGKTSVLSAKSLKLLDTYRKSRSGVAVNESAQGSLGNEKVREPQYHKIGSMTVLDPSEFQIDSPEASVASESKSKSLAIPKKISSRRLSQFTSHTWCFVGYDDGSIGMYQVN